MCSNCSGDYENPELTGEPIEQGLEPEDLQAYLERCYANYRAPSTASLIQQRGVTFPSPLVGKRRVA